MYAAGLVRGRYKPEPHGSRIPTTPLSWAWEIPGHQRSRYSAELGRTRLVNRPGLHSSDEPHLVLKTSGLARKAGAYTHTHNRAEQDPSGSDSFVDAISRRYGLHSINQVSRQRGLDREIPQEPPLCIEAKVFESPHVGAAALESYIALPYQKLGHYSCRGAGRTVVISRMIFFLCMFGKYHLPF